jgi:hypothetical protein
MEDKSKFFLGGKILWQDPNDPSEKMSTACAGVFTKDLTKTVALTAMLCPGYECAFAKQIESAAPFRLVVIDSEQVAKEYNTQLHQISDRDYIKRLGVGTHCRIAMSPGRYVPGIISSKSGQAILNGKIYDNLLYISQIDSGTHEPIITGSAIICGEDQIIGVVLGKKTVRAHHKECNFDLIVVASVESLFDLLPFNEKTEETDLAKIYRPHEYSNIFVFDWTKEIILYAQKMQKTDSTFLSC